MSRDFVGALLQLNAEKQVSREALVRALAAWGDELPADPTGWLITVAWRAFLDMARSDAARRDRQDRFDTEPPPGAGDSDAVSSANARESRPRRVGHVDVCGWGR